MSGAASGDSTPVSSRDDLIPFFRAGEKPRERWLIGTEHEKVGLREGTLEPVPYEGEAGIGALLRSIQETDGWTPTAEGENVIALTKDGASITLEPGGQFELSGAPLRRIYDTCAEFQAHLDLIRRVSEPLGLVWLSLGANPIHDVDEIPHMPKGRYDIMRAYLPTKADLPLHMMHLTATVQANFDFSSEADMANKMRMAMGVTPIVSAIFANSPLYRGKPSGYISRRLHIWRHTDPDRCGMLPFVFEAGFGYADYAEWALDIPMFFVVRDGTYQAANGMTFRQFMERGFGGESATLEDWSTHLTTLFPEVRCKQFIEVRGADAVPPDLICALPALWKGLLYDDDAMAGAWELVKDWAFEQRVASIEEVARHGMAATIGGRLVRDLARELLALSSDGLARIDHRGGADDRDERGFLDPVAEIVERGTSPGEEILKRWDGEWGHRMADLVASERY